MITTWMGATEVSESFTARREDQTLVISVNHGQDSDLDIKKSHTVRVVRPHEFW
jgi:hypothetical protein